MLLNVIQAAPRLGISASTLYQLVAARRIAHLRVGTGRGGIRFTDEQIDSYLAGCVVEPACASVAVVRKPQLKHLRL